MDPDDQLKSWHHAYITADGDSVHVNSDVINAVRADDLDHDEITRQIEKTLPTLQVSQGFCGECHGLFQSWPDLSFADWANTVGRKCSTYKIEAAARQGCDFCAFILSKLVSTGCLEIFRKVESRLRILGDDGLASLSICQWGVQLEEDSRRGAQILWLNLPAKVATGHNSPGARILRFNSFPSCPARTLPMRSLERFELAATWLRECCITHANCPNIKSYSRPTRLVSIANEGDIRLVLTGSWHDMPPYATLSYAWGDTEFTMLTVENMDAFLNGEIPLHQLPSTFRDAIHVTRLLGLSHIWIDALCIIQKQPSRADWSHEAALMQSVYSGSHLNIAASSAKSVYAGFLRGIPRPNALSAQTTVAPLDPTKGAGYSTVRGFQGSNIGDELYNESHLAGRGWCLQEKLLPPRTLSFGDYGLFWECRTHVASEFLPDKVQGFPFSLVQPESSPWSWSSIVIRSSATSLTYARDRLPSLSGVVRRQIEASGTGDEYVAGMWKTDLDMQLLWYRLSGKQKRPGIWIAPSWSWVSVDSSMMYPTRSLLFAFRGIRYTHVLDAWTRPEGPDAFGAMTDGKLVIATSSLIHGRIQKHRNNTCISTADAFRSEDGPDRDWVIIEGGKRPLPVILDCLDDVGSTDHHHNASSVFLFPICSGDSGTTRTLVNDAETESGEKWVATEMIKGLVLQRSGGDGSMKGHFHRVGFFNLEKTPIIGRPTMWGTNEDYDELMAAVEACGETTARGEAHEIVSCPRLPRAQYVITIE